MNIHSTVILPSFSKEIAKNSVLIYKLENNEYHYWDRMGKKTVHYLLNIQ